MEYRSDSDYRKSDSESEEEKPSGDVYRGAAGPGDAEFIPPPQGYSDAEKGRPSLPRIDQGNEAILLDVKAAGKSGATLKLAKDGRVRGVATGIQWIR